MKKRKPRKKRSSPPPSRNATGDRLRRKEQKALQLHERGNLVEAEALYREILDAKPNHPKALHFLGILAMQRGRHEEALELMERCIELQPASPLFHYNLGNLFHAMGKRDAAAQAFMKTIERKPDYAQAHGNLGQLFLEAGHFKRAEECFRKAAEIEPASVHAHKNLAVALVRQERKEEAIRALETVLRLQPDHADANHYLAALTGENRRTADPEYVVGLFDNYADRFETHLTGELRYRTPDLLREAVGRVAGVKEASWRVLDLGCGTGLCGPPFRDLAAHMSGVDLSPRMLERAREKGVYETLREGDLRSALRAERGSLDLAIAADVFIYVGDLEETFEACRDALREGGLFTFSTESFLGEGFILRHSARFAHSARYIEELAEKYGFSVSLREDAVLRIEKEKPIAGHIFVLCKGKTAPKPASLENRIAPEQVQDAFETARLHHQAGHLGRAETLYRRILEIDPDHADSLHFLGVIAHQRGNPEAAIELISQAIQKKPEISCFHTNLGLVFYAQGKPEEAIASLRKSLELNPASPDAHNNLAAFLRVRGRAEEAAEHFRRAVELRPGFAEAHNNLAGVLLNMGLPGEAEHHYRRAVEAGPEYATGHRDFAKFLIHQGRFEEAGRICQRLLKLRPGAPEAERLLEKCAQGADAGVS